MCQTLLFLPVQKQSSLPLVFGWVFCLVGFVSFLSISEHSTPPSPLTPWEDKNVGFFPVSFQSLNLLPSFTPLFPPFMCFCVMVLPRESKPFALCTLNLHCEHFWGVLENKAHTLDHHNRPISSVVPIWPSELSTLLCKFNTGH